MLKFLNRLGFLFHNLFVPLLIVVAVKLACNAGVAWASNPVVYKDCWAIAIKMVAFGLVSDFRQLELIPTAFAGTLRRKPKSCGVPILTILTALLVVCQQIIDGYADSVICRDSKQCAYLMPKKKYIVSLTSEEREYLDKLTTTGKISAYKINHARVFLLADTNRKSGGWIDQARERCDFVRSDFNSQLQT